MEDDEASDFGKDSEVEEVTEEEDSAALAASVVGASVASPLAPAAPRSGPAGVCGGAPAEMLPFDPSDTPQAKGVRMPPAPGLRRRALLHMHSAAICQPMESHHMRLVTDCHDIFNDT